MFTFPPAPSLRHKTVIEKIQADMSKFDFFIVLDDGTMCHALYITDGKIWWDAGDGRYRITATVASPFRTYAKGFTCVHGPLGHLPRWVDYLHPYDSFVQDLFGEFFRPKATPEELLAPLLNKKD